MKLPILWIPQAAAELQQARAWYDNVRPALGERFALAVDATVEAIAERPMQYPVVHRGRRRAGVRRFPYGIFFEVQVDRIVVIACSTPGATRRDGDHDRARAGAYTAGWGARLAQMEPCGLECIRRCRRDREKTPLKRPKTGRSNGAPELKIHGHWEWLPGPPARNDSLFLSLSEILRLACPSRCSNLLQADFDGLASDQCEC